ncbi:MAG: hypothetical protein ACFFD4_22030 [Candidatus Odinarchaeota archaeon]
MKRIFSRTKKKQQVQLNELILANANRLEQVHQEVQNRNFEEAKAVITLMRDNLNVFYRGAESIELRKQIREQQRRLDLEAKIRDMDNFLTYSHYEETKEQMIAFQRAKKFSHAIREAWKSLLLLQDIEELCQKYDIPVPSRLENQIKEIKRLYKKFLKNKPEEM